MTPSRRFGNANGIIMASLLPKNGVLYNCAEVAPAPSKDYCQLLVTKSQVVFRWWRVTIRKTDKVAPGEEKDSYQDFEHDERIQMDIRRVFGKNTLEYIKRLVKGHIDYFPRLPRPLLLKVIGYLDLEDIANLAQVSKQFRELCQSDDLWKTIYEANSEMPVTDELASLAEAVGWQKLFFTNKLQLQVQLRRQANIKASQYETVQSPFLTQGDELE